MNAINTSAGMARTANPNTLVAVSAAAISTRERDPTDDVMPAKAASTSVIAHTPARPPSTRHSNPLPRSPPLPGFGFAVTQDSYGLIVKKWQFARTVGRLPRVRGAGGSGGNMIIEDVFRYAHSTPEKIALWDRGQAITYAEFAYWIAHAREEILKQNLRAGTIAVLMELPCRL